jgi:radical SAM protein with 4Fe4S-binding SPASM domain
MIDIHFYALTTDIKRAVMSGFKLGNLDYSLDQYRSHKPMVYNIESTNSCNQKCLFCPRTNNMTRPVKTMKPSVFKNVVNQLEPHSDDLWHKWVRFAQNYYGVPQTEQSEDAFFLYIITRAIVLHGYGDPLLDPHIPEYVGLLSERNIPSYFSCNPANIRKDRIQKSFDNGLSYIKFSIDSLTDSVRGMDAFENDYPQIMRVLEMDRKTQVIITMIDLGQEQFDRLKEAFKGTDVYIYQKSLDQSWLTGKPAPKSIHWSEPCQIPWTSMTIDSNGLAVSCEESFNSDIILGDTKTTSLYDIWNGKEYADFRKNHIDRKKKTHCTNGTCDMRTYGSLLKG